MELLAVLVNLLAVIILVPVLVVLVRKENSAFGHAQNGAARSALR